MWNKQPNTTHTVRGDGSSARSWNTFAMQANAMTSLTTKKKHILTSHEIISGGIVVETPTGSSED